MQQQVKLTPEQITAAAGRGAKLLSDEGRVNVPPSMALDGSYSVLVAILTALGSGQAILSNPVPAEGAEAPNVELPKAEVPVEE